MLFPNGRFLPLATFRCHFSLDSFGVRGQGEGGEGDGWSDANQNTASPSAHAFSEGFILEEASMPRRPKPFFHRGWWCTNVGGTRTKLAQGRENKDAAEDALLDLLNERQQHPDRKTYPQLTVRDLCEKFLDWVELHRSLDTYHDYRDWLNRWQKLHGTTNPDRAPCLSRCNGPLPEDAVATILRCEVTPRRFFSAFATA